MSNPVAAVGAFVNRKFSINRNTGQPRVRRFSIGEPSNTGEQEPPFSSWAQLLFFPTEESKAETRSYTPQMRR